MDTADKLVCNINYRTKTFDLNKVNDPFLFVMEETGFLSLTCECSPGNEVQVECDSYALLEKDKYLTDGILKMENGIKYQISGGDLYYLPGLYRILFKTKKETKEFLFRISRNKELSEEGYHNIIERIEELIHGLIFDLRKKGKNQAATESLFALRDALEKEYLSFRNDLSYLLLHLSSDLKNAYVRSDSIGRIDCKAIRMNLTHPSYANKPISKKKEVTYDTLENRNIKKMIKDMKKELLLILIMIDQRRKAIVFEETETEESSNSKKMVKKKMRENKSNADNFLSETDDICRKYFTLCTNFLNHPNIRRVKDIKTRNFYSRKETELKKRIDELLDSSKTAYRYKSSQQIFEYYGYYLIHNVLVQSGYQLISELDFTSFCENETCIYYESENRIAAVFYGPYCENYLKTTGKDITVSINSQHKSPDFIIRFYDKNNGDFLFENVFEVKYIPFRKLDTVKGKKEDIIETASDYLQFGYLSENKDLKLGVVHKVFVLFVAKSEQIIDMNDLHRIYLLGVDGTENEKVETFLKENLLN